MKVLVCGGRGYHLKENYHHVYGVLNEIHAKTPIALLIQGGASGADSVARKWSQALYVPCLTHYADWAKHGQAAGPIRNRDMLQWKPELVVAFPGGYGTENMVKMAMNAGIEIWDERSTRNSQDS
jgi:hypothetical protein